MQRWEFVFCLLTTFLCCTIAQEEWNYGDQRLWEGDCTTGRAQSPIMLDRDNATTEWRIFPISSQNSIEFYNYDEQGNGNFTNTGHTVQMNLEYNNPFVQPRTVVTDAGTTTTYFFRSFHFHWPSEHQVNDERYPLELHMVHTSQDNRILVLGYFFRVCDRSRSGMEVVGASARRVTETGDTVDISQFAPSRIMPKQLDQCGYFQYTGSLTTPPCSQGVTWLVREEPLCVTQEQMAAFNSVLNSTGSPMAGNARDLQPINGRTVTYHRCLLVSHWRFFWWWW